MSAKSVSRFVNFGRQIFVNANHISFIKVEEIGVPSTLSDLYPSSFTSQLHVTFSNGKTLTQSCYSKLEDKYSML